MKRRIVMSILSAMLIASLVGCGSNNSSTDSASESTTETIEAAQVEGVASESVEASTEYNVLTIKTDWEEAATITFSESGMTIDGTGASDEDGVLYITEGGAYTLTGTSSACSIVINTEDNVKLILNGVDLTSTNGPVIYGAQVKNLYVELAEGTENTLTDSSEYATDSETGEEIGKGVISCEDDIIVLGEGTLNITANHKHGITSDDKIYIEAGTINITSNGTDGINANDLVCIDGGNIDITSVSDLIESEDMFVITGGTITGNSEDEGIEAKGNLYINGGTINITAVDDGLNAGNYIEINDGEVTVTSTNGDAIDSNGNYDGCITINGGTVNATGADVPEGGLDADQASVIINGGTVTASGGTNSPITENGGEVNITGDTNSGMGPGGPGMGGGRGQMPEGELPEDFDGTKPQMNGGGPRGQMQQDTSEESTN